MMATKYGRRSIALLVTIAMLCGMLPTGSFAVMGEEEQSRHIVMNVGETYKITDAAANAGTNPEQWESGDEAVAQVTGGTVYGAAAGETTIVHTYYVARTVEVEQPNTGAEQLPAVGDEEVQLPPADEPVDDGFTVTPGEPDTGSEAAPGGDATGEADSTTGNPAGDAPSTDTPVADAPAANTPAQEAPVPDAPQPEPAPQANTEENAGSGFGLNAEAASLGATNDADTELIVSGDGAPATQVVYEMHQERWTVQVNPVAVQSVAIKGSAEDQGVVVTVEAPEGAFPEGTELRIVPMSQKFSLLGDPASEVKEAVAGAVGASSADEVDTVAFDITFVKDGEELQPAQPVAVNFVVRSESALSANATDSLQVVHVGENAATVVGEAVEVSPEGETQISVEAEQFSVYALTSTAANKAAQYISIDEELELTNGTKGTWKIHAEDKTTDASGLQFVTPTSGVRAVTVKGIKLGSYRVECSYGTGWGTQAKQFFINVRPALTTVSTVDSTKQGINMYMHNYADTTGISTSVLGGNYQGGLQQNIVERKLGANGYPVEKGATELTKLFANGSPANYLFSKDENGYLYYNSMETAATFDKTSGNFTVYNELVSSNTNASADFQKVPFHQQRGNFFPYNTIDTGKIVGLNLRDLEGNSIPQSDPRYKEPLYGFREAIDYYFGLNFDATFVQPKDGQVNGADMVYEFTGDDDLWIFIDDVLVLDLGGIHDAQSGSIDFATGKVKWTNYKENNHSTGYQTSTIKQMFEAAGVSTADFAGDTFADYTEHEFAMFYMERGAGSSNLRVKFNLPTIPTGTVNVTKQVENPTAAVANKDFTFTLSGASGVLKGADYTIFENNEQGAIGKTDAQTGEFTLKAGQMARFNGLPVGQYSAEETAEDDGRVTTWPSGKAGKLEPNGSVNLTCVNDYSGKQSLTVTKQFAGAIETAPADFEAQFSLYTKADYDAQPQGKPIKTVSYSAFQNGDYTFTKLHPGEYVVVEKVTQSGDTSEAVFDANASTMTAPATIAEEGNGSATIINKYKSTTQELTFTKTWEGHAEGARTSIDVTIAGGSVNDTATIAADSGTTTSGLSWTRQITGNQWSITVAGIPAGADCTVTETKVNGLSFTENKAANGTQGYWIKSESDKNALVNTYYKYKDVDNYAPVTIGLLKIDAKSQSGLGGAKFNVYADQDCQVKLNDTPLVSDPEGKITFQPELTNGAGTIYFKEIEAPAHYVLNEVVYAVTVTQEKSGQPSVSEPEAYVITRTQKYQAVISGTNVSNGVLTVENTKKQQNLRIVKSVQSDAAISQEPNPNTEFTFSVQIDGVAFQGAYEILSSGQQVGQGTPAQATNGIIKIKGGQTAVLPQIDEGAAYQVTETSIPDGFTPVKTTHEGTIGSQGAEVTFVNQYFKSKTISVSGQKSWPTEQGAAGLPASITVELLRNGQPMSPEQTKTITAQGNWSYDFGALPLRDNAAQQTDYTYSVRETAMTYGDSSDNVELRDGKFIVYGTHVAADKTREILGVWVPSGGTLVEGKFNIANAWVPAEDIADGLFPFKVHKTDANGTSLAGASFTLTGGNNVNKSDKSNEDGEIDFGTLEPGTYTLTETEAPEGYYLDGTSSWTVTVSADKDQAALQSVKVSDTNENLFQNFWKWLTSSEATGAAEYKDGVMTVKNTRTMGTITITKQLSGGFIDQDTEYAFKILDGNGMTVQTLKVKAGQTVTSEPLPYGTYKIEEVKPTNGAPNYNFDQVTYTGDGTTTQAGALEVKVATPSQKLKVTATNAYTSKLGALTVQKTVSAADGVTPPAEDFTFTVQFGTGAQSVTVPENETEAAYQENGKYTFTLAADEKLQITGVPYGTGYSVTEASNLAYSTSGTVKDATFAGDKTVNVTNTYITKGFMLEKVDAADKNKLLAGATFALYKSYVNGGVSTQYGDPYEVGETGQVQITNLPVGTYYLKETKAPENYQLSNKVWQVNVAEDGVSVSDITQNPIVKLFSGNLLTDNKLTVENTAINYELTISKTVTGTETDRTYYFDVKNGQNQTVAENVEVKAGSKVTLTTKDYPLLLSGTYTVTEVGDTDLTGYTLKSTTYGVGEQTGLSEAEVTLKSEVGATTKAVSATNTYTRDLGDLTIQKSLAGVGAAAAADKVFTFDIAGPQDANGTYSIGSDKNVTFAAGKAQVTITGANSLTIQNLPTGSYTVTEEEQLAQMQDYTLTVTGNGQTVTVAKGGSTSQTITNTYSKPETPPQTNVNVEKTVTGLSGTEAAGKTYTFAYTGTDMYGDSVNGTVEVKIGASTGKATLPLVPGSYTFTEVTDQLNGTQALTGYTWEKVYFGDNQSKQSETIALDKVAPTVAATNHYSRNTGSLTLSKTVSGNGKAQVTAGKSFAFTISGPADANGTYGSVTFANGVSETITLADGESITMAGLPAGDYIVQEAGSAKETGLILNVSGQVGVDGAPQAMEEENGKFTLPSFALEKNGNSTVAVTNTYTLGSDENQAVFGVRKLDSADQSVIKGVTFALYADQDFEKTPVQQEVTGEDGIASFKLTDTELGTGGEKKIFYLREVTPAGYQSTGTVWTITVDKKDGQGAYNVNTVLGAGDGGLWHQLYQWFVGSDDANWNDGSLTVYNDRKTALDDEDTASVQLRKTDANGDVITNNPATFTLKDENGTITATTEPSGIATITFGDRTENALAEDGTATYEITETGAPDGYEAASGILGYVKVTRESTSAWSGEGENRVYLTTVSYEAKITGADGETMEEAVLSVANDKLISVSATKVWQDVNGNELQTAPTGAQVVFTLMRNGESYRSVTLDGTPDENGELAAWEATFDGLSPRDNWTVQETTGLAGYTALSEGIAVNGTIINRRDGGKLTLVKTLNDGAPEEAKTLDFTFDITGPADVNGRFDDVLFTDGKATVKIKGAGSKEFANLPTGEYTVTEQTESVQLPYHTLTADGNGQTVVVETGKTAETIITNRYSRVSAEQTRASLTIEKAVRDARGGSLNGTVAAEGRFTFHITGTTVYGEPVDLYRTVTGGEGKVTINDLAFGGYTVTEVPTVTNGENTPVEVTAENATAINGYDWTGVAYSAREVALSEANRTATFVVTNTYAPQHMAIPVVKTWSGAVADGIVLELYADGTATGIQLTLDAHSAVSDGSGVRRWAGTFASAENGYSIYRYADGGKPIQYSVKELSLSGASLVDANGNIATTYGYWTITSGEMTEQDIAAVSPDSDLGRFLSDFPGSPVLTVLNAFDNGGGGGNTGGGGGNTPNPDPGTDIPENDVPLGDMPGEEIVDIPEVDVPAGEAPDMPDESITILEEDVPLSDAPRTGDQSNTGLWMSLLGISALGIVLLPRFGKRKEEE